MLNYIYALLTVSIFHFMSKGFFICCANTYELSGTLTHVNIATPWVLRVTQSFAIFSANKPVTENILQNFE